MSDPRFTDPRDSDPRLDDPVLRTSDSAGGMWGWIAGIAVLALIAFIVIAGWNTTGGGGNTASNAPSTTTNAPLTAPNRPAPPVSTTGSGETSPQPQPPAAPAAR
jgi:hypothetical protein